MKKSRIFIIIILIGVLAFSGYKVFSIISEYRAGTEVYEEVKETAVTDDDRIDFDALCKKNKDIKAWLSQEDSVIDYPVVQGDDNEYYLYRMVNGEWNGKGTLFIDYRHEKPFEDFLTIIYGHRMKDGSMFHSLTKYRDESYYKEHKTMDLFTPEKDYTLEIFDVVTIPSDSSLYRFDFDNKGDKEAYLEEVREKSELNTGIKADGDDKIVMMSTCTYEFEDARLVVYGKLKEKNK